jgi:hypothetical protein
MMLARPPFASGHHRPYVGQFTFQPQMLLTDCINVA